MFAEYLAVSTQMHDAIYRAMRDNRAELQAVIKEFDPSSADWPDRKDRVMEKIGMKVFAVPEWKRLQVLEAQVLLLVDPEEEDVFSGFQKNLKLAAFESGGSDDTTTGGMLEEITRPVVQVMRAHLARHAGTVEPKA